jgi:glucokinase
MADIATLEEARAAAAQGASFLGTTMRGYTEETRHVAEFDREFVAALTAAVPLPVIAEGMIWSPEEARAALAAGAYAVVVGTAITRPHEITRRFVQAMGQAGEREVFAGVDCGGTRIKYGLVDGSGRLLAQGSSPTPASGRAELLEALRETFRSLRRQAEAQGLRLTAAGLATAGWVNRAGEVVYATGNLPGWGGTRLREELEEPAGGRLTVENDAHAFALAERRFGRARGVADFLFVTLGTGVGGACVAGGRLLRGANELGGALGHFTVEPGGATCGCGRRGCLEAYAGASGLRQDAGAERFAEAGAIVTAAQAGDPAAVAAVERQARYLAVGLAQAVVLMDPKLIVLGGGLAEGNELLRARLEQELPRHGFAGACREVEVAISPLGYYAGVLGAASAAMENFAFVRS